MGSCAPRNQMKSTVDIRRMIEQKEKEIEQMKNLVLLSKIRNCPKLSIQSSGLYNRRQVQKIENVENWEKTRQGSKESLRSSRKATLAFIQ